VSQVDVQWVHEAMHREEGALDDDDGAEKGEDEKLRDQAMEQLSLNVDMVA
jgi:hypothetical protein